MLAPQPDQPPGAVAQVLVRVDPVEPRDLVVLAVGVVVASLGAAHLVAAEQQGQSERQQQGGEHGALPLRPEGVHRGVFGRALGAGVPGTVVVAAVPVALAVRLVVLAVVGDQVVQRETIVHGDQVHRGGRPPARALCPRVQVRGPGEPGRELGDADVLAPPEVPHVVAVAAVPLPPLRREPAEIVAVRLPDVPRLGDELGPRHHGILGDQVEERRELVEAAGLAGQGGGQVEPEAVHVHLGQPVAQAVHHHPQRDRAVPVERVPGAGRVVVLALVIGYQTVILGVVQAPETQRRAVLVPFRGVVVDDVQDHLDALFVEGLDHVLELGGRIRASAGVALVRGEEADRVITPVVGQALVEQLAFGEELMDRQQLDRGDAEIFEVTRGDGMGQARVGAAKRLRDVRMVLGEALDVRLVDDRVGVGGAGRRVPFPVIGKVRDHGPRYVVFGIEPARLGGIVRVVAQEFGSVDHAARAGAGVGVEEQLVRVAAQAAGRVERAADPVAVFLARPDARHVPVPDTRVVAFDRDPGLLPVLIEQAEGHRVGDAGGNREVRAVGVRDRAELRRVPGPGLEHPRFSHGSDHSLSPCDYPTGLRAPAARRARRGCRRRARPVRAERAGSWPAWPRT